MNNYFPWKHDPLTDCNKLGYSLEGKSTATNQITSTEEQLI